MAAGKYKLTYFNLRGRAEHIRLIFAAADVPFEDVRIDMEGDKEQWKELKPKTPFGGMPVLEIEGKDRMLGQSSSIARFVAKEFNLAGKDNYAQALADMVAETAIDVRENIIIPIAYAKDEADKEAKMEKARNESLPTIFDNLKKILGNQDFFVNNKLTYADLCVLHAMEFCDGWFGDVVDKYPELQALRKRLWQLPGLAKYKKVRPVTKDSA